MKIDANGLAWVWHLGKKEWVKRHSVDAREAIKAGECAERPPVESGDSLPPGFTEQGPPAKEELEDRLGVMPKPALRELCETQGVPYVGQDSKAALVAKLVAAGVSPESAPAVVDDEPHTDDGAAETTVEVL